MVVTDTMLMGTAKRHRRHQPRLLRHPLWPLLAETRAGDEDHRLRFHVVALGASAGGIVRHRSLLGAAKRVQHGTEKRSTGFPGSVSRRSPGVPPAFPRHSQYSGGYDAGDTDDKAWRTASLIMVRLKGFCTYPETPSARNVSM